jgi:hypothetical protein
MSEQIAEVAQLVRETHFVEQRPNAWDGVDLGRVAHGLPIVRLADDDGTTNLIAFDARGIEISSASFRRMTSRAIADVVLDCIRNAR